MKNVLVLHGPNLNLLGERPGDDRALSLDGLNHRLQERADALQLTLRIFQSNHEGELIDRLHAERRWADGVLISPEALAHTSYVLREAIAAVGKPAIEVHLTDIRRRESWRRKSVIKDVCQAQLLGKGVDSYLMALERLASGGPGKRGSAGKKAAGKGAARGTPAEAEIAKTVGRGETATSAGGADTARSLGRAASGRTEKTLGRGDDTPPARREGKTLGRGDDTPPARREGKALGRGDDAPQGPREGKTLGRGGSEPAGKTLGGRREGGRAADFLTRALVRQKISERLSGKLTPVALASWARLQWNQVQEGGPAEAGHRDMLEDALQTLTLSNIAASRLSDEQLLDLMAQLEG